MEHVKIETPIKVKIKKKEIVKNVLAILEKIPDIENEKNSLDLLIMVCNLIENCSKHIKKYKLSKKELVLDILKAIFGNTFSAVDISRIENDIETIHGKGLIKKISICVIYGYKIGHFLCQKLL